MGMSTSLCHTKDIQAGRTPSADSLGHTLEANSLRSPWTHGALLNGSPWWTLAGQAGSHSTPLIPCEQIRSSPLAAEMDCLPHPHPPLTALIIITCPRGEAQGRVSDNSLAWDTVGSCQGPSPPLQREQDNAGQHRSGPFEAILSQKALLSSSERSACRRWHLGDPRGGKNQKTWNARSAEEKNEASRGSYDTTVKLQLLRGMGGSPGLRHAHIGWFRGSSSALSSWVWFLKCSLFLLWLHHDILIKVSAWEKKTKKRTGNTIKYCI